MIVMVTVLKNFSCLVKKKKKLKLIINYRLLKFKNVNVTLKHTCKYRSDDIIGEETHLIANRQHL